MRADLSGNRENYPQTGFGEVNERGSGRMSATLPEPPSGLGAGFDTDAIIDC